MLHACMIHSIPTEIKLSFSEPSYTVTEDAGVQTNLIAVVKEDNRTTEKILKVMVQVPPYSDAKQGTVRIASACTISKLQKHVHLVWKVALVYDINFILS